MNTTSESPNTQNIDDLNSDMGDSADEENISNAATPPAAASGATVKPAAQSPARGVNLGHDVISGGSTGNG